MYISDVMETFTDGSVTLVVLSNGRLSKIIEKSSSD